MEVPTIFRRSVARVNPSQEHRDAEREDARTITRTKRRNFNVHPHPQEHLTTSALSHPSRTETSRSNLSGERYVFAGVAEQVKYKSYVDRLQAEEAEHARRNPIPPATVVWAVVKGMLSERYYISAKCSRANCTALAYDAPPSSSLEQLQFLHSCDGSAPADLPAAVAAQYRNLFSSQRRWALT